MGHGKRVPGWHQVVKIQGYPLRKGLDVGIGKAGVGDVDPGGLVFTAQVGSTHVECPRRVHTESILLMLEAGLDLLESSSQLVSGEEEGHTRQRSGYTPLSQKEGF